MWSLSNTIFTLREGETRRSERQRDAIRGTKRDTAGQKAGGQGNNTQRQNMRSRELKFLLSLDEKGREGVREGVESSITG